MSNLNTVLSLKESTGDHVGKFVDCADAVGAISGKLRLVVMKDCVNQDMIRDVAHCLPDTLGLEHYTVEPSKVNLEATIAALSTLTVDATLDVIDGAVVPYIDHVVEKLASIRNCELTIPEETPETYSVKWGSISIVSDLITKVYPILTGDEQSIALELIKTDKGFGCIIDCLLGITKGLRLTTPMGDSDFGMVHQFKRMFPVLVKQGTSEPRTIANILSLISHHDNLTDPDQITGGCKIKIGALLREIKLVSPQETGGFIDCLNLVKCELLDVVKNKEVIKNRNVNDTISTLRKVITILLIFTNLYLYRVDYSLALVDTVMELNKVKTI